MSVLAVLSDTLHRAAVETTDAAIVHVLADGSERELSPRQLLVDAARVGGGLRAAGIAPGDPVLLVCGAGDAFVRAFWGATAVGAVPVPLALEEDKLRRVWTKLAGPALIVDEITAPLLAPLAATGLIRVLPLADLMAAEPLEPWHPARPDDVAFLQFSSGSTGAPKGVLVRHRNLVHNIAQQNAAVGFVREDVVVSWMPYFHDLGLIGMHLAPIAVGAKQVRIDPLHFVKRPVVWLDALHRHRGTVTGAASFALGLVCKRVADDRIAKLDLSAIRLFGVGAEPISPRMCRAFAAKLAPSGFDARAIKALYGLAEATLAVASTPLGEALRVLELDRDELASGRAVDAAAGPGTVQMTELGVPVPDCRIRVVDDADVELADDQVGHIQVAGEHVTTGYHGDEEASAALHCGEWLRTGDVGFVRAGRLTLTGRAKEILIVNGRNFYASDLESVALDVPGVRPGRIAVVGYRDTDADAEQVVAFIGREPADTVTSMVATVRAVRAALRRALGHEHVVVLPIPKQAFPRTTSGKLQRVRLRKRVEAGEYRALADEVAAALAAEPTESALESEVTSPVQHALAPGLDEIEVVIAEVWARVLECDAQGLDRDADFRELGGTSLRAMEVLAGLEDAYGRVFEPAAVRDCATVRLLAARVRDVLVAPDVAASAPAQKAAVEGPASVAVLSSACRFPGADSPEQFWQNLIDGVDSVGEVPPARWSVEELEPGAPRWGAFLAHVDGFDGELFGMADDEAAFTDPHQRIMLEVAHEALERAGYAGERRVGKRVGMFVAVSESEYQRLLQPALGRGAEFPVSAIVGNLRNLVAARLSQCLDLTGPAIAVDTACSSALVALHLARNSLLAGECDLAVVGAVSLNLTSTAHRMFAHAQALSPSGRCRTFSADADGFVPGEGAGAVVLARHADAIGAGDEVLALVRGSAINNDGRSMSAMAPNPVLQAQVIADAYSASGVDPATVSYIEAHGTGTAIGDPIELRSLATTFAPPTDGSRRGVGSVKTNIGHLLNAAGMPGLIKVVLSLQHQRLAPSLHYAAPIPSFDLAGRGFEVVERARPWTSASGPLRAAVNAFGFGGTNAHVILEQAPPAVAVPAREGPALLTLSARTDSALRTASAALATFVREHPGLAERRIAASASVARDHLRSRLAVVSSGDLAERLDEAARRAGYAHAGRPRVAFLFAGQGSQRPGQGSALYERWPVFRGAVDRLSRLAGSLGGRSLVEWLIDETVDAERLRATEIAQPVLVAFELALAELWADWGIVPCAVVGHSVGELAAAAVAGALPAEAAVRIAVERGRLMSQVRERGAMAAVFGDVEAVRTALGADAGRASIAAINAPKQVAIAGAADAVARIRARLDGVGIASRPLVVSHAFHSPLMDAVIDPLRAFVDGVEARAPALPWISTVTAEPVPAAWRPSAYFADHVSHPVRFAAAVERLAADAVDSFVELGPKRTLTPLVAGMVPDGSAAIATVDGADDVRAALAAAGALWERGAPVRRGAIDGPPQPWLTVPTYPFERRRHWVPVAPATGASTGARTGAADGRALPALGLLSRVDAVHLDRAEVSGELRGSDPVVADHRVCDFDIVPGAALWQLALEAAGHVSAEPRRRLADVTLFAPLRVDRNERRPVAVSLRSGGEGYAFELRAGAADDAVLVATGRVERGGSTAPEPIDVAAIRQRCSRELPVASMYAQLAALGMVHGAFYQCLGSLRTGDEEALGRLELSARAVARGGAFELHPALIDAAMQVVAGLAMGDDGARADAGLYIPFSLGSLEIFDAIAGPCLSYARVVDGGDGRAFRCDVSVCSEDGRVLVALRGLELRRVTPAVMRELCAPPRGEQLLHHVTWREVGAPTVAVPPASVWIVPDAGELHVAIAGLLGAAGSACTTLEATDAAARLAAGAAAPDSILFLRGLGLGAPRSRGALERGMERSLLELATLARAIDARDPAERPRELIAMTSDACGIAGARAVGSPLAAALATYAACLADELPGLAARAVDVSSSATAAEVAAIAQRELGDGGAPSRVAWVGERRQAMNVEAGAPGADAGRRPRLRDDSVLLITGGATGVGAAVARALAAPDRRVVLVGRTALGEAPPRAALVDELSREYASARYVSADVTDDSAVKDLVADILAVEGRLTAVVHAAGVADPDRIGARDDARVRAVLAPKVVGGWLLAQAVAEADCALDFFAMCSSVSAVLPGLGGAMADYAAANAFLDGLAGAERAGGQPFVSINWSIWGETGMGAHPAALELVRRNGLEPLATRDGVAAFRAALATGAVQVVVADRVAGPELAARDAHAVAAAERDRAIDLSGLSIERALQTLVGAALSVRPEQVPTEQSFLALGLDSLAAVDLVKKLERHVGRTLSTTLFFEYDTIDRLVAYLGDGEASPRHGGTAPATASASRGAPDGEPFELTPVQRAFYANHYLYPEVTAYAYLRLNVSGAIDEAALGRACALLEQRHPMLRARFSRAAEGPPRQWTAPPAAARTTSPSWFRIIAEASDPESFDRELCNERFDLATGEPPLRAVLWRRAPEVAHLGLCLHHIAGDAWSLNIIADELWRSYTSFAADEEPALPALAARFSDCVVARSADDERRARDLEHWRAELQRHRAARAGALPYDGDPNGEPTGAFGSLRARAEVGLVSALRERAAAADVSLVHLLLAAYGRCLARWSGQGEVGINVARAGREARVVGIERIVGSFADTLPLYADCAAGAPAELARRLREAWLASERHGAVTTVDLANLLNADGRGPRVAASASFSFARFPVELAANCPLRIEASAGGTASAATRLGLAGWEQDGALLFSWNYPERLFGRATVERFAHDYLDELAAIAEGRNESIAARRDAPVATVVERILERCRQHPERVAVEAGDRVLRYGELDERSARVAAALRARGIRSGQLVGLLTGAGGDASAAIVGILRAGAAWVPLDPDHPPRRLRDQLQRAELGVVVCHAATRAVAAQLGEGVDRLDLSQLAPFTEPLAPRRVGADATAYVIHTSGSTGRPKAVPIRHSSMQTYLGWAIDAFGYTETDRFAQTSSLCFDACVRQILAPLMVGATSVVVDKELARDPERLLEVLERGRLTVWSSVPSLWGRLLALIDERLASGRSAPALRELRWLHIGGEALSAGSVRRWIDIYGTGHRVSNLYGPTEATINATCHIVRGRPDEDEVRVPIGTPVAGARVRVVGDGGGESGVGEVGELWIGGAGLSPGYLGEPELTARAFVVEDDGTRWYRSGDRVRVRNDGQLEFIGRVDDQIKLRGYRVEPGEIESVLEQHTAVRRAAVVVDGDRLGAFVEARGILDPTALRRFAAERLPDYMVPGGIEVVEQLPETSTGKLDRAALRTAAMAPATEPPKGATPISRELTPVERVVAEVWAEVLGVPSVGVHDDFFHLGGDSLLILEVFARLQGRVARLPRPTALYRHRTVATLAAAIAAHAEAECPRDDAHVDAGADFGLAPAQIGFLIAEAIQPGAGTTWSTRCEIDGPLDPAIFQRALDYLVERHGMLRTVFPPRTGLGAPQRQRELAVGRLLVTYDDLSGAGDEAVEQRWRAHLAREMAPGQWPLVRTALLRLGPARHLWLVTAHHLIGDGYSAALLGRELVQVYDQLAAGEPPSSPPLRSSFRDYVAHMAQVGRQDRAADEAYWRDCLGGVYEPPVLRTCPPTDVSTAEVNVEAVTLDYLRELAATADTTLYTVLLTAFARAAGALTGRDELILGTAVSGRDVPLLDVTRVFGCFATTLPVRVRTGVGALAGDVAQVHRVFAEARERALPPDRIARLLPGRSPAQTLGAQLFFTYLDFEAAGAVDSKRLALRWDDGGVGMDPPPQTDILVAARPSADGLRITVKGRGVPAAEIERFAERLRGDLSRPVRRSTATAVDAALVGYLPAARDIAALFGDGADVEAARARTRALLGLRDEPRALEVLETPLGRSAFVCLPIFADELHGASASDLAGEVDRGIRLAARHGARCVSLAGLLPALTRYGYAVSNPRDGGDVRVTTGHAATAVSVVKTLLAATGALGVELAPLTIAFVGVGSIGRSSLQLLLSKAHPERLVLCDAVGRVDAVAEFVVAVRDSGYHGDIELVEGSRPLPRQVYEADLIVGAASTPALLDIDALRPGTIVVDDSFPHIFEPARAIERMRTRADVLIVGGGLLDCRTTDRELAVTLDLPAPIARALSGYRPPGVVASCQLESLLCAAHPGLPTVRGLVEPGQAREYWDAVERAGIDAAALHLQQFFPGRELVDAVRAARSRR